MVFKTCRTIYNIKLQTAMLVGAPYNTLPNTTLNEKFGIIPNYPTKDYPRLNLITIGIGGNPVIYSEPDSLKTSIHKPVDASLFEHVPFLLVKPDEITDDINNNYRLRKTINIDGTDYVAFYGMVLNNIKYQDELYYAVTNNDTSILAPYDTLYNQSLLNPTPILNNDLTKMSSSFIFNMCKIPISLEKDVINNINNALKLLYPDKQINAINEIGLCSSVDVELKDGTKEAVNAQINYFVDVNIDIQLLDNLNNDSVNFYLEIGGAEPLYN